MIGKCISIVIAIGAWGIVAAPAPAATCLGPGCTTCAELRFDFESGDLQGWAVVSGKFDKIIADREWRRNTPNVRYNQQGKYYLNTLEKSGDGYDDAMTGVIESPVFIVGGPTISFLIGGGSRASTRVALCTTDGREVISASGKDSEQMDRVTWNVRALIGKKVFIEVVDENTAGWGHVTCDDFVAQGVIDLEATKKVRSAFPEQQARRVKDAQRQAKQQAGAGEKRKERLMSDRNLRKGGKPAVYKDERLEAISIPIGGIGAGCIQMDGAAKRTIWQIFNNHRLVSVPDSFFAIRVKGSDSAPKVRALQTEPVGPFPAMKQLTFQGEYPFGQYTFRDPSLPVGVRLEAFSPLVPVDLKNSAIPCAVFRVTVTNRSGRSADVSLLAAQQNAAGYTAAEQITGRASKDYGGNVNRILRENATAILHMSSNGPKDAAGYGDMALTVSSGSDVAGCALDGAANWDTQESLLANFAKDGAVSGPNESGPSPQGQTIDGALSARFSLAPGAERTVTFLLTWCFPNATHGENGWGGKGNMYTNWWPNALESARDVQRRLPELTELTRRYHDTLYASNLPRWLVDRVSSQVAILRSRTCFWTKEGYFGAWEGCGAATGCCFGNCDHVWHYAQAPARLFPELGRLMRDQDFAHQSPGGGLAHRQAPKIEPATDGQFGAILGAYREYLMSSDRVWLDKKWPAIKAALEFAVATWDKDEDGVLSGKQWNTLDDALGGSTSWMGTLYLASLAACEKLANVQGDAAATQRYARIRQSGQTLQDQTLFNGEYYIQIPDSEPRKDYGPGCHIDQLLGQWWAHQVGLGWLYPRDHTRTALASLLKYNLRPAFYGIQQVPRQFVADADGGMQMITWPHGGRPAPDHCIYYGDEVMSGFEYSAAAEMIHAGLLKEGFAVVRAISDRYDGRLRTRLTAGDTASWGYSGNPFGDDECGKFYGRAMSAWSLLIACQGFVYDGPNGMIGFHPVWRPEDHASFFTVAEGWGLFTQTRTARQQTGRLEIRRGQLRLNSVVLDLPEKKTPGQVTVTLGGRTLESSISTEGTTLTVSFPSQVALNEGDSLDLSVTLRR
ncbi:MAG: glucosylceramidase [Candidatus Hydrogenedentes bacterium]|nr:glucosylceramidase [Candidatus Hydrogenedentota bacterium]